MKQGKNPSVKQIKAMQNEGLDADVWLVYKTTAESYELVHRVTKETYSLRR